MDSKAFAVTFIRKIHILIIFGLTGAILGSGLYLIIALNEAKTPDYICEKEYYIEFTNDWSKDYYNDFTWNDIMSTDSMLGKAMSSIDNYDRDVVKEMIEARILSDVRYLTVKFTGKDKELISILSKAMDAAIIAFPDETLEISNIRCIEAGEVKAVSTDLFTLRAALLGAILSVLIYIFVFSWKFSLQEAFYTRYDIIDYLGIHAFAIGEIDEKVMYLANTNASIEELKANSDKKIVIAIPQGKECKGAIKELFITAANAGIEISGATLVNCSKGWLKMYGINNIDGVYGVK